MILTGLRWAILGAAVAPSFCYLIMITAGLRFFRRRKLAPRDFTPPVSFLKPVHGLEPDAYENFASFCRQNYPQYEILFGVTNPQDPAIPIIQKIIADYPALPIRLLVVKEKYGSSDKVNKLCALSHAAKHDIQVLSDADIRVGTEHLRTVAAPFRDAAVGAVTSMFTGIAAPGLLPELECVCLSTDFMAAILMAWQLEGIHFAMGATIAVRRQSMAELGGFEALADEAADDYEIGRRIAARGHRVELVDADVKTWCCLKDLSEFFFQRLRWAIMARQARPLGWAGLIFSQGLPLTVLALVVARSPLIAAAYIAAYVVTRMAVVATIGVWGLHDNALKRRWWLVPVWDVFAFVLWFTSLCWSRVRWRGKQYRVANGRLIPVASARKS